MPSRVSSALTTSRHALGVWAVRHLTELTVRVAERARQSTDRVPPRLQRLGAQAWQHMGAQAWQRLEALLEVIRNPGGFFHPVTRAAALRALAPRLVGERMTLLVDAVRDVDAEVSLAAIGSLAQHAPSHVVLDALMPILVDHTGFYLPVVRDTAVNALERAGLLSHA